MRIVIALGGNALLKRGEPMTVTSERANVRSASEAIAAIADGNELVVTHGNGPQVGLLALQASAYDAISEYPFDVLGAATEGMIGYLIEQELGNVVSKDRHIVTLVTQTEVDAADPAFDNPTKFVGPVYTKEEAESRAAAAGWTVRADGEHYRRVVPSPLPVRMFEIESIATLLDSGAIVVCAGGGGVPTMYDPASGELVGVEAVIDKDRGAAVLARDLSADRLVIATDTDGVYVDWGTPDQKRIVRAHPDALADMTFPAGSMGPKVESAIDFARTGRGDAVIGALQELPAMLAGTGGTTVSTDAEGITFS